MCLFMAESQAPSQDWFLQALPCLVLSHSLAFQCLFHCLDLEFIHLAIPILYLASFYKPNKNGTHLAGKTSKPTSDSTTLICPDRKRRERDRFFPQTDYTLCSGHPACARNAKPAATEAASKGCLLLTLKATKGGSQLSNW